MSGKSWDDVMEKERAKALSPSGNVVSLFPDVDENATLPDAETEYKASSFQASRPLVRLCCIMGRKEFAAGGTPYRAFQYVHLDSDSGFGFEGSGQVMTLRFAGMLPATITIRGRNLLRIWDYIQLHRMAWIRVADRDFEDAEAVDEKGRPLPFITGIEIVPVLPLPHR